MSDQKEHVDEPTVPKEVEKTTKSAPHNTLAILSGAVFIIVVVVISILIAVNQEANTAEKQTSSSTPSTAALKSTVTTPATTAPSVTTATTASGVTWQKPEKLADLGLISKSEIAEETNTYYKIGTTKDKEDIVLLDAVRQGMGLYSDLFRFIKKSDGYYLLTKYSTDTQNLDTADVAKLKQDKTTAIPELSLDSFTKSGTKFVYISTSGIADTLTGTPVKVDTTDAGNAIYTVTTDAEPASDLIKKTFYYVQLPDTTRATYQVRPVFMKDDGMLEITWIGTKPQSTIYSEFRYGGCGMGAGLTPTLNSSVSLRGKKEVGSTTNGSVYQITDTNSTLVKYLYDQYKSGRDYVPEEAAKVVSIDKYLSGMGYVLWTDVYNHTLVYLNNDYGPLAECGKPVIYLYPQQETQVSVKVGAQITKSDPTYNNGWTVTAEPDGTLKSGGKTYGSLFWEGLGLGSYPAVGTGTTVMRSDLQATIRHNLSYIGLNDKEIVEFLDFWMPKMPTTPYVRLTWFQNKEMNALAPLTISPKPDSVIRVFLDFAGVNSLPKTPLKSQPLHKMPRTGFTVVEWGGLLRQAQVQGLFKR